MCINVWQQHCNKHNTNLTSVNFRDEGFSGSKHASLFLCLWRRLFLLAGVTDRAKRFPWDAKLLKYSLFYVLFSIKCRRFVDFTCWNTVDFFSFLFFFCLQLFCFGFTCISLSEIEEKLRFSALNTVCLNLVVSVTWTNYFNSLFYSWIKAVTPNKCIWLFF